MDLSEFDTLEKVLVVIGATGAVIGFLLEVGNVELFESVRLVWAFLTLLPIVGAFAANRIGPQTQLLMFLHTVMHPYMRFLQV